MNSPSITCGIILSLILLNARIPEFGIVQENPVEAQRTENAASWQQIASFEKISYGYCSYAWVSSTKVARTRAWYVHFHPLRMLNHQLVFQSFDDVALRYIAVLLSHMHLLYCFHIDCKILMSCRNTERRESALSTFRLLRHICNFACHCTFQCISSTFSTKSTSLAGLFLFWILFELDDETYLFSIANYRKENVLWWTRGQRNGN